MRALDCDAACAGAVASASGGLEASCARLELLRDNLPIHGSPADFLRGGLDLETGGSRGRMGGWRERRDAFKADYDFAAEY